MKTTEREERKDPVARMVCDLSAEEVTDWLINYHGLGEGARATVESNLREQFKWHRLQGRLDQNDLASTMAELLSLRQSVMELESPSRKAQDEAGKAK